MVEKMRQCESIPGNGKILALLQNTQTGCGAHPISCSVDIGRLSLNVKALGVILGVATNLKLSTEFKNQRSYLPLPTCFKTCRATALIFNTVLLLLLLLLLLLI
jgi:hypothetical protein